MKLNLEVTSPTADRFLRPTKRVVTVPSRCADRVLGRIFPGMDLEKPDFLKPYLARAVIRHEARAQRRAESRELQQLQGDAATMSEWSQRVRQRVRGSSLRTLQNTRSLVNGGADLLGSTVGAALVLGVSAMITGSAQAVLIGLTTPAWVPGVAIEGARRTATVTNRFKARVQAQQLK